MTGNETPRFSQNHPGFYANMGAPMSRTRTERIRSTLLGKARGQVRCLKVIRIGLAFEKAKPLLTMQRLLKQAGFASPEDLRGVIPLPEKRLICRLMPKAERLKVRDADPDQALKQALFLGLCTEQIFDPARPVLWTETSLTRCLELFDTEEFYS